MLCVAEFSEMHCAALCEVVCGDFTSYALDPYGNHVVQKCITKAPLPYLCQLKDLFIEGKDFPGPQVFILAASHKKVSAQTVLEKIQCALSEALLSRGRPDLSRQVDAALGPSHFPKAKAKGPSEMPKAEAKARPKSKGRGLPKAKAKARPKSKGRGSRWQ